MPRYTRREYRVGDYWLSQRPNSPAWCRTWFDGASRQTRRVSLGTTDFEEARQRLDEWFVENHRPSKALPETVTLAEIMARYYKDHGQHTSSEQQIRIAANYWLDYFGDKALSDITPITEQEAFVTWLRSKGHSEGYIARILTFAKAAINRAWKRGEIATQPFILTVKVPKAQPKGRPLSLDELRTLYLGAKSDHVAFFILIMLGTACRPDAALDLTKAQCDFEHNLIDLNPAGRAQTKKHRPIVKMPPLLKPQLKASSDGHVVGYHGKPLESLKGAWRRLRADAELGKDVQPYSLRHTAARWLRKQGVDAWQVSTQLGHRRADLAITEVYTAYDPAYLQDACAALNLLLWEVAC